MFTSEIGFRSRGSESGFAGSCSCFARRMFWTGGGSGCVVVYFSARGNVFCGAYWPGGAGGGLSWVVGSGHRRRVAHVR